MKKILGSIKSNLLTVSILFAAVILFAACNKNDNDTPDSNDFAGILAFNLSPDKPGVGFAIEAASFTNQPLAFTSYTGGYQPVYPGSRTISAYDFYAGTTIASDSRNFESGKYYSAFLVGYNGNYKTIITDDNADSLTTPDGNAYVRYINAIPDSSNPTVKIAVSGTDVINEQAAFGNVSSFKAIIPGNANVNISVSNGGTINSERTISTEANKIYTILLAGIPASNGEDSVQIRFIQNGTLQ